MDAIDYGFYRACAVAFIAFLAGVRWGGGSVDIAVLTGLLAFIVTFPAFVVYRQKQDKGL